MKPGGRLAVMTPTRHMLVARGKTTLATLTYRLDADGQVSSEAQWDSRAGRR